MNGAVTAIYENGVLRLLTPLTLPEHTRVRVRVERILEPTDAAAHRRRIHEALVAAGLSLPAPYKSPSSDLLSAERREELARLFSTGRPLSELIIEERNER